MRRSLLGAAVLLALPFAAFGPVLWSGGKTAKAPDTPAPKVARSKIDKVTVYPNSALVTRTVEVPEGTGLVELTITPMPDRIVLGTMYSEAGDGLRVLTTRFTTRVVLEDTSEARRTLESELEKIMVSASKIDSDLASLQKNMELLAKLENVAQANKLTGDEVIAMSKYVMAERTEKAKAIVDVLEQKRLSNIQLNFIQRKMGELGRGSGKMERDAVIVVDREAGKGGKIRLNYLVSEVTWRPEYKVRAGKISDDVQLDYLANLMQHSGEDWNQVKMTLSTAQPMLNASPPELCMLQPILVMRGRPGGPPMPGASEMPSAFANPTSNADLAKRAMSQRAISNDLARDGGFGAGGAKGKGAGAPKGVPLNQFDVQKETDRLLNEAAAIEQNLDLMRRAMKFSRRTPKGSNRSPSAPPAPMGLASPIICRTS